ncbi:hypothetical protein ACFOG5_22865 [Pedobacter fastidiosus]|uniref:hypothetical protein n=1 Tax=Pedobacter fastidiosus TaxID=2765361 RepID=UPI002006F755|nr:hypothetical protein [Pedobacter fastidiosus]
MKLSFKIFFPILFLSIATFAQKSAKPITIEAGVSLDLATFRSAIISNIQYKLQFNIPSDKNSEILASEQISFDLSSVQQPLQLDFKQSAEHVKSILINGTKIAVNWKNEHLIIDQKYLRPSTNKVDLQFIAGNESLNRNNDYLYALFVPDHARTVFPCFDQPDLKANFLLTLTVPKDWKVLANGLNKDSVISDASTTYNFANSDKLPTYLFSFTAGNTLI